MLCTANLGHLPQFTGLKRPASCKLRNKKARVSRPSRDRFRPANTKADSAGGGGRFGLRGAGFVHNGGADEVAPFGPRAVVVANLVQAQQIFEDEPGVGAALTDAAVRDDVVLSGNTLGLVEFFQLVVGLERDRKSTRLNSSHVSISYAVFCLKKKKEISYY